MNASKPSVLDLSAIRKHSQQGFTLLEVMIALAILAVASAGLVTAAGGYIKQSQRLEDKVFAAWAAENWLNELRLAEKAPEVGEASAQAEMAGRQWLLRAQVSSTSSAQLRRLDIKVYDQSLSPDPNSDSPFSAQLTAFVRSQQ
ncbi:general secretion pathway protein I [Oceanospirillum multiglobuliferum]|uniref:Type II secretion system protein I n=1 Tax=Oceanospirillum multiglobuliferum TaxID=64969 RepID=A0A1T4SBY6_9GAMM|nr:type II secretion system minor pseudopilin GspI [Oceanospirillum multiglobuliferum]OPX55033.1 type II secretion system protein GspI [Oceanospirillum multiglobuliferum]SKA25705.1 general secretion pathway protein I [Oceanospirillum multiglobuliferum]